MAKIEQQVMEGMNPLVDFLPGKNMDTQSTSETVESQVSSGYESMDFSPSPSNSGHSGDENITKKIEEETQETKEGSFDKPKLEVPLPRRKKKHPVIFRDTPPVTPVPSPEAEGAENNENKPTNSSSSENESSNIPLSQRLKLKAKAVKNLKRKPAVRMKVSNADREILRDMKNPKASTSGPLRRELERQKRFRALKLKREADPDNDSLILESPPSKITRAAAIVKREQNRSKLSPKKRLFQKKKNDLQKKPEVSEENEDKTENPEENETEVIKEITMDDKLSIKVHKIEDSEEDYAELQEDSEVNTAFKTAAAEKMSATSSIVNSIFLSKSVELTVVPETQGEKKMNVKEKLEVRSPTITIEKLDTFHPTVKVKGIKGSANKTGVDATNEILDNCTDDQIIPTATTTSNSKLIQNKTSGRSCTIQLHRIDAKTPPETGIGSRTRIKQRKDKDFTSQQDLPIPNGNRKGARARPMPKSKKSLEPTPTPTKRKNEQNDDDDVSRSKQWKDLNTTKDLPNGKGARPMPKSKKNLVHTPTPGKRATTEESKSTTAKKIKREQNNSVNEEPVSTSTMDNSRRRSQREKKIRVDDDLWLY